MNGYFLLDILSTLILPLHKVPTSLTFYFWWKLQSASCVRRVTYSCFFKNNSIFFLFKFWGLYIIIAEKTFHKLYVYLYHSFVNSTAWVLSKFLNFDCFATYTFTFILKIKVFRNKFGILYSHKSYCLKQRAYLLPSRNLPAQISQ